MRGIEPLDRGRLVHDDPDQLEVGPVEVALPDRGGGRRHGSALVAGHGRCRASAPAAARTRAAAARCRACAATAGACGSASPAARGADATSVSRTLAFLNSNPRSVRLRGRDSRCPPPTRRPAASLRSSPDRSEPRPGRAGRPGGRRPAPTSSRNASAPSLRRKSQGSRPAGRVSTRRSSSLARKNSKRPIRRRLPGLVTVEDQHDRDRPDGAGARI